MSLEKLKIGATTEVKRAEESAEDLNALSVEDLELINRVLAEAPEVASREQVSVPKNSDELLHRARTETETIADARVGINPHGVNHIYGEDGYQSAK